MKVLFVASECAPFIKTGGLADVIGALPKALRPLGAHVRTVLPAYPALAELVKSGKKLREYPDLFGGKARLFGVTAEGLDLLLLDAPHLFDRPGNIYLDATGKDWSDNALRFGALSKIGADIASGTLKAWNPDVVHAHDWQAGLVSAYLAESGTPAPPVAITIHNVAFQGVFPRETMEVLGLSKRLFSPEGLEYYGNLSFLKGGLALADKITTVSPTYARELLLPEFGAGLDGLLQARKNDLVGILNGIDLDVWNPADDPHLKAAYSARGLKNKAKNKTELERRFALEPNPNGPLFCVVSRLTSQKGLDLLLQAVPNLVAEGASLAVLGTGEPELERGFVDAARTHSGRVGAIIGYDEPLSHLMQAGSDAILIPSRFEPCGLTQLYGLRYGTLPVVARTGGLADTVIDANDAALAANAATGLQFSPITAAALEIVISRTCTLFRDQPLWTAMMRRAMKHQVGWDRSAIAYMDLYQSLIE